MKPFQFAAVLIFATFRLHAEDSIKINVVLSMNSLNKLVQTIYRIDKSPIASISTKTTPMVRNNDPNTVAVYTGRAGDLNVTTGNYYECKFKNGKWSVIYKSIWHRTKETKSISADPVIE